MKIGFCVSLAELEAILAFGPSRHEAPDFVDLSGQELCQLTEKETMLLAERLQRNHLFCGGIHATFPPSIALIGAHKSEQEIEAYASRLVQRCKILACDGIGIGSPASRTLEKDWLLEDADRQMVASLQQIAELAKNIHIFLESIHKNETNYICTAAHAARLMARVDRPNVKMVADIYHYWLSGEDVHAFDENFWNNIGYLHIADPDGRSFPSPDTNPEFQKYALEVIRHAQVCSRIAVEARSNDIRSQIFRCYSTLKTWEREVSSCLTHS